MAMNEMTREARIDAGELAERLRRVCARFDEFRGRL